MRNKHAHLYYIDDETKRKMLDIVSKIKDVSTNEQIMQSMFCFPQYVSRYEENVTPGMIASVPSQGNEQMAATILQVVSS